MPPKRPPDEFEKLDRELITILLMHPIYTDSLNFSLFLHRDIRKTSSVLDKISKYSNFPFLSLRKDDGVRFAQISIDNKLRRKLREKLLYACESFFVSALDTYLYNFMKKHTTIKLKRQPSSSFREFLEKMSSLNSLSKQDFLDKFSTGKQVFKIVQSRHKIIHTSARVDQQDFIDELNKMGVPHGYKIGQKIEASAPSLYDACQAIRKFAMDLEKHRKDGTLRFR